MSPEQDITNLPMDPTSSSSFNKHLISLGLIHFHLINRSESGMKGMWHHQTPSGLPKHFPKKTYQSPCTIWYTAKITNFCKCKTVYTTNL